MSLFDPRRFGVATIASVLLVMCGTNSWAGELYYNLEKPRVYLTGDIGGAYAAEKGYWHLGVGARAFVWHTMISVGAPELWISSGGGDTERYYFDGGADRCRDSSNGRFVSSSNCNETETSASVSIDGTVNIPHGVRLVHVGLGIRAGDFDGAYGVFGITWTHLHRPVTTRLLVGDEFVGASVGMLFRI